jgi:diguanylate cyclase (GGDEF)-like protein/PAS domain S-box-containing protein
MVAALLPYLAESVLVVRDGWEVAVSLAAPDGLVGRARPIGTHVMSRVHPDDALRLFEVGTAALRTEPGWSGTATARIRQDDGTFAAVDVTIHNRLDHPVIRGMVVCTRAAHVAPAPPEPPRSPAIHAETLAEVLPIGVAILLPNGTPLYANPVAAELLGADRDVLCGGALASVLRPHDGDAVATTIEALARRVGRQRLVIGPDAEDRMLELDFVSRGDAGTGEVQVVVLTIQDVTHRYARERQLEHLANHDPLTGLANRAWLLDHLHERMERGDDLVVAFVDLDRFKAVNDRLGHHAGDDVLTAVGAGLLGCLHPGEVAARVGGDEFVVVSAALDADQVADFDQRIRLAVATVAPARRQRVGASVGVATSIAGDEPWALLQRADSAMYEEKRRVDRRVPTGVTRNGTDPTLPFDAR